MTGPGSHNYTDLPPSTGAPSGARVVTPGYRGPSYNDPSNKKMNANKYANIALLIGVIALIGSLAFAITRTQQTTGTRAATESFVSGGYEQMPESTAFLTRTITEYPKSYKGIAIPQEIYQAAERKYVEVEATQRKKYIINRVAMYYIIRDVLKEHNIEFEDPGEKPAFNQLEDALPIMKIAVDQNLLSTADFAFVKAYFTVFNNQDAAQEKFGDNLQPKALELVNKYRQRFESNPSNLQQIVDDANADPELRLLANGEKAMYFRGYFADLNNVPEQDNYIYDEEFDDILFTLQPNQVSQVIGLNSVAPYMYIVVYPTNITIKQYQSLKDIVALKLTSFTY